ncbi:hypothetical protein CI15_26605 [Paraburkholderia monticola]|uniref:Uncharacterized protein n=1 Tax=Paraburkholderia monticola TaxID=1399968 RepID=A0A149PGC5_9BURK|nr:hypothetical protein CI15_26605 [Paraburkholderia monticola]
MNRLDEPDAVPINKGDYDLLRGELVADDKLSRGGGLTNPSAFDRCARWFPAVAERNRLLRFCSPASVLTHIGFSHDRADFSAGLQRVADSVTKACEPSGHGRGQNGSGKCCGDERFHDGTPVV